MRDTRRTPARAPGAEEQREVSRAGRSIAVDVSAGAAPCAEKQREVVAAHGTVAGEVGRACAFDRHGGCDARDRAVEAVAGGARRGERERGAGVDRLRSGLLRDLRDASVSPAGEADRYEIAREHELPCCDQVAVRKDFEIENQRAGSRTDAGSERRLRGPIPARDAVRGDAAGGDEVAARHQIAVRHHDKRLDLTKGPGTD